MGVALQPAVGFVRGLGASGVSFVPRLRCIRGCRWSGWGLSGRGLRRLRCIRGWGLSGRGFRSESALYPRVGFVWGWGSPGCEFRSKAVMHPGFVLRPEAAPHPGVVLRPGAALHLRVGFVRG